MLILFYLLFIIVCLLPLIPGIVGIILSSFSYIPLLGFDHFSLEGFFRVFDWQGIWTSISLTTYTALLSTYLACLLTFFILQTAWDHKVWRIIERTLAPLLAMPHVAFSIGFAFLFAPTGMAARFFFTWFGYDPNAQADPSLALLVKDPYGLGLIIMLALKEVPFLLMMSIPILQQLKVKETQRICFSMGYSKTATWFKCLLPQWFLKMRFPLMAVITYGASVVDVALVIGPTHPTTLSVLVWQWFNDPDLLLLPRAAAGAMILLIIISLLIVLMRFIEHIAIHKCQYWQFSGRYQLPLPGRSFFFLITLITICIAVLIVIWSFAQRWRFPDLLPSRYSIQFWQDEWISIVSTLENSLLLAMISASIALFLGVIAHEYRLRHRRHIPSYLIALPMLLPQLSILLGMQVVTLYFDNNAHFFWVAWAHVFFAFPFVYLSLDGPWRSFDQNLTRVALSLGKSPLQAWFKVKLPILFPALTFAWVVGASVSLAQYLPTLILGAGRISTITTEAVALSSGFDRRITAIYAIWQTLLPLVFFSSAFVLSRLSFKYHRLHLRNNNQ
ncbi:ABC transporter permease [Vibrio sagamiensis]|uniref:ABC transporter permease n=1 Tax=Vibrio sagamiensis NBRC 104589 TaxID=1219064 RepID=A0A511QDG6_9VIBR|nr:thiamine ABC transporter permease [Vibrio sagamiensis]PNQ54349.1 thiamine ABC transporter permease [Vibrio agarivorans]GEM74472.1 ABC transporter permease [Vibrio sagamiensis NBRC 104589]